MITTPPTTAPSVTTEPANRAPTLWVVSDGRRGIENQALGLAEAIARRTPMTIAPIHLDRPTPWRSVAARLGVHHGGQSADDHNVRLWIGCGRAAMLAAASHQRRLPNAVFVYVQDPKRAHTTFDLIIAPDHDELKRPNAVSILGSPNRITGETLTRAQTDFAARIARLPTPRAAALIGGASKRHRFTPDLAATLITDLTRLSGQAGLMISTSRRTPPDITQALKHAFAQADNVWLWTGAEDDGPNPYFAFLAAADVALVTQDSTNMLTEAASAGVPVLMLPMAGAHGKFAKLYSALVEGEFARPFTGTLDIWQSPTLRETERAADAVMALLSAD